MKILFPIQDFDFLPPLGLMQISAIAKQRGDKTYLSILSRENIWEKIEKIKPDHIAYTSTTGAHNIYTELNKEIKIKYPEIFTLLGGPHATFFPEVLNEGKFDAICIGEADYIYREFLERLEQGKDLSDLENMIIKGKKLNGLKPLVQNLDELPFPDRELFYSKENIVINTPIMGFMTSRGCPFACTYCYNHKLKEMHKNENYLRRHSVDYAIEEILDAKKKYNFGFIRFVDDTFVLKHDEWLEEFTEKYIKKVNLPFYIHQRFELLTPKITDLLKQAGCKAAQMSIESANPRIRKEILKRNVSDEKILTGSKYCRERGISIVTNFMVGLPTSTLEDDINAVDFSIKAKIPVPEFFVYQPYPKTELGEYCVKNNLFDGDLTQMKMYGFSHNSLLNCFSEKEKNIQRNIALLGPLAVRHPYLRNLIMNKLIYKSSKRLFEKIYTFEKQMVYPFKVYKMNYSFKELFNVFKRALKLEKTKRS